MQMDARVAQSGRATISRNERQIELAFVKGADSGGPIIADAGLVRVADNEARSPRLQLRSQVDRPVRAVEIGWMVRDANGREFVSGAVPVDVTLAPHSRTTLVQDVTYRFTQPGGNPIAINEMKAYLASVEFADGLMWVPDRSSRGPTPSPEEQRLTELYRKKGMEALVAELNRLQ